MSQNLTHPAVLPLSSLIERLRVLRLQGKRVVFTNGCFDILHPGHVDLLTRAKSEGDVLVIGLNSDDSVRRLNKGHGRPFNPFTARSFVLAHLSSVDFIVRFDEDTPYQLIRAIEPDVLVKGGDWNLDAIVGRDIVEARGGKVLSLSLIPGWSTTDIVARILREGYR